MGRLPWIFWSTQWRHPMVLVRGREKGQSQRRRWCRSRDWSDVLWRWRKRPRAKGYSWPLAAEEANEADPALEPPEGSSPANTLTVAQWDPHQTSGLQNWKTVDLYCFKLFTALCFSSDRKLVQWGSGGEYSWNQFSHVLKIVELVRCAHGGSL